MSDRLKTILDGITEINNLREDVFNAARKEADQYFPNAPVDALNLVRAKMVTIQMAIEDLSQAYEEIEEAQMSLNYKKAV